MPKSGSTKAKKTKPVIQPELAGLARLITYARQDARSFGNPLSVYCLDMALASILEQMNGTEDAMDVHAVETELAARHGLH